MLQQTCIESCLTSHPGPTTRTMWYSMKWVREILESLHELDPPFIIIEIKIKSWTYTY